MVSLTAKRLSVLGIENTVHTSEAAVISASITFSYTCCLGLYAQIYVHTLTRIAEHHSYLCHGGIRDQPTHVVLTLLDYGD